MKQLNDQSVTAWVEPDTAIQLEGGSPNVADLAQRLLDGGLNELSPREQRVISTIASRRHVSQNVNRSVSDVETVGDRVADRVARFGGSWTFIIIFVSALLAWIALNTWMLRQYCCATIRMRTGRQSS